ncbi:flagellar assembly peptidoglycan hydrolase FlgJ [Ideonella dechloratans]|uniref:Peptidoglycan hydrolase FlgJ n=1 Tax=Ideonella dechloratans TaxID=36863 RepID=A0A643FAK8_IDEDE|nr:flagellar assembly peptidoglycan hydrolase FlgJ [Ideonella dechloratans]KAB0581080.1 flagellar assembly peptidoglycan hydrolase FlgJ [Ideonella dechloratans]UFU09199.1 flagellar assembly peptidoglycan hydrolase FlgJ [Ideonella dechloratans]
MAAALPSTLVGANAGLGDARGLDALRTRATKDPKAVAKEAAKQFETLFMQQLLKSMREATKNDDGMDNDASKMGAEMLDSQWATRLAGRPGGLADVIARQMEKQIQSATQPVAAKSDSANTTPVDLAKPDAPVRPPQQAAANFVQQHQDAAQAAEAASGIPASFMIAQAAHETGWGRKEIRNPDGSSAHNLFGIKAGANWSGPTTDVTTTEYIGGVARKVVQKFRAYASYAESFADYAKLMANNPRYQKVVAAGSNAQAFAQGLQKAGYATDPSYADKLGRVINTTLRLQRSLQA